MIFVVRIDLRYYSTIALRKALGFLELVDCRRFGSFDLVVGLLSLMIALQDQ